MLGPTRGCPRVALKPALAKESVGILWIRLAVSGNSLQLAAIQPQCACLEMRKLCHGPLDYLKEGIYPRNYRCEAGVNCRER